MNFLSESPACCGSPLGAYDQELWRARQFPESDDIQFLAAINEGPAAMSVQ